MIGKASLLVWSVTSLPLRDVDRQMQMLQRNMLVDTAGDMTRVR
jgi:hypothetical protein